ncbi:MAG: hypothetical protein U1E38_00505 [Rhodospirillales bacterium]
MISGNFSLGGLLAGGVVPFAAGILGGWLGERRQGTLQRRCSGSRSATAGSLPSAPCAAGGAPRRRQSYRFSSSAWPVGRSRLFALLREERIDGCLAEWR